MLRFNILMLVFIVLYTMPVGHGINNTGNRTVLLLSDNSTQAIQTLIDRLTPINITVTYISHGISQYEGKPNAFEFDVIILMSGQDVENDMPEKGQHAIVDAVTLHEKGLVMTEDAVGRVPQFQWKYFRQFTTGHPIWNDIPPSFTTSQEMMVVLMAAFSFGNIQPIALIGSTPLGDIHGVIARDDEGVGRIVQIAHAAHFYPNFDWNQDENVTKMMINSIKWVAKLT